MSGSVDSNYVKINAVTRNDAESATRRTESALSTPHSLLSTSTSQAVPLHHTPSRQSKKIMSSKPKATEMKVPVLKGQEGAPRSPFTRIYAPH